MGEGPRRGPPRRDVPTSFCKAVGKPFIIHNTTECRRFNKDGSQKDRLTKPFDSAKKPWNKPGSGDPDQISHLTEEIAYSKRSWRNLRGTVRNVLVNRRIVTPTINWILGPVAWVA